MRRNQVSSIFSEDTKRKQNIILFTFFIILIFIISVTSLYVYVNRKKVQYVRYSQSSLASYDVYLKDNDFYKTNNLKENNEYVSELIDYINAVFKHNISLEKNDVEYKYAYRIEASAQVNDKQNNKNIYSYDEILLDTVEKSTTRSNVTITENVKIDFNKYNTLINKFIQTYKLTETNNVLTIKLYVNVIGSCKDDDINQNNESVTTIEIPLTQKIVDIDIKSNIINNEDNVMLCIKPSSLNILYIITTIITCIIDIVLVISLIRYVISTRTAQTVYEKELKKILSNYRSYIQKINNTFNLRGYQSLKVDNFTDMLEIRDTTNQPILMVENGDQDSTYFVIPTATKLLYIYSIRVKDIEKEMNNK